MHGTRMRLIALLCCLPLLAAAAPASSSPVYTMWEAVQTPQWDLMVRSVERSPDPAVLGNGEAVRPDGHFVILTVDITNRTGESIAPSARNFLLRSDLGVHDDQITSTPAGMAIAAGRTRVPFGETLSPGQSSTTILVFDVPSGSSRLVLLVLPDGPEIRIDECKCHLPSPIVEIISRS